MFTIKLSGVVLIPGAIINNIGELGLFILGDDPMSEENLCTNSLNMLGIAMIGTYLMHYSYGQLIVMFDQLGLLLS